tara:strand:- start:5806 stop:7236 length:1431 start_codon:yes stop_codon:yes gene_type:complete
MNYDASVFPELSLSSAETDIRFDKLTHLASTLLRSPVSLLTVIDDVGDRQLFKSAVGVPEELLQSRSTPLSYSFCKYVRDSGNLLYLEDARKDKLHKHNPAIEAFGIISYLGVPFHGERGHPLGALCCMDQSPRQWTLLEVELLKQLASIADDQFYLASAVRDRVRAKLLAEKAARTRASFLSHANHEVRTPLSAISGAARLLSVITTDNKAKSLVEAIERNVSRLRALTDDLVRIAELDAATSSIAAESFNLSNVIEDVVDRNCEAAHSKGIALKSNTQATDYMTFLFDATVLRNILDQLVLNAIQFTTAGEVQVATEVTSEQDFAIIRVSDTGVGMGHNLQKNLFDEFEGHDPRSAREGGGSGLGMNIIKREIELMGGTISLSSKIGEGSQFIISLPTSINLIDIELEESSEQSNDNHIICLECGERLALLRRHIRKKHSMTPEVYRIKWGLPVDFEFSSPAYKAMRLAFRNRG